tara:strand:- start:1092 stop:2072 length:981 start_codon:yes stop_codon:yes gene_type:complete
MAIAINGTSNTITGLAVGGLPDGTVDADTLASNAVTTAKIADDAVDADKLANSINTEIAANTAKTTNATHTGEVTGATALTIADDVVDEANLKVSNSPTNGYFLSAQSGNTGGLTWANVDLTALSASNLTSGTLPDARFPATLPAVSAANLTSIPAANITGTLPAISGANLTGIEGIPTGMIQIWSGLHNNIPTGYLLCNGAEVSRSTYSALFAIVGEVYGSGDESSTFLIPNLSSRFVAGYDASNSSFDVGDTGGNTSVSSDSQGNNRETSSEDNNRQIQDASSSYNGIHNKQSRDRHQHYLDWTHSHSVVVTPRYLALCYIIKT